MTDQQKSAPTSGMHGLIDMLRTQAARIRELEQIADSSMHENGDIDQYTANLHSKAELLSELSDQAQPYLKELPADQKERIAQQLGSFSRNARQALDVDSIFFMRQLLYPEDYQEGQENDLERFISALSINL
ncbi:MAG: hypothetical protein U5L00_16100 [Desulfovermiculus sp.]|nr:hypothetical protein [Desulfovermiculus sp.]MDZ7761764.1 hypothetical protein [Desulfovermiculus sp.]